MYIRKGNPIDPISFLRNIDFNKTRKDIIEIDGDKIKLHSDRYKCFKNSGISCVKCGIKGKFFYKEKHATEIKEVYHLNLYGIKNNKEVLITKDHRIPKSKGGVNHWSNYDTMCLECNMEKGNKLN